MTSNTAGFGSQGTNYGQFLFLFLVIFQVVLLAFITPALTAGAISGERERQTLDLLFVTPIAPFSIIWGKLLASMSFVALLLIISYAVFCLEKKSCSRNGQCGPRPHRRKPHLTR